MMTLFLLLMLLVTGCGEHEPRSARTDPLWERELQMVLQETTKISSQSILLEGSAGPIDGTVQSIPIAFRFVTPNDVIMHVRYTTGALTNTFEMQQYPATEAYWNVFTAQERDEGYAMLRQPLLSPRRATHIALTALGLPIPFNDDSHGGLVLRWDKATQATFKVPAIWAFLYLERGDNNAIISHRVILDAQNGAILEVNRDW
jgi:hypothetical protein